MTSILCKRLYIYACMFYTIYIVVILCENCVFYAPNLTFYYFFVYDFYMKNLLSKTTKKFLVIGLAACMLGGTALGYVFARNDYMNKTDVTITRLSYMIH